MARKETVPIIKVNEHPVYSLKNQLTTDLDNWQKKIEDCILFITEYVNTDHIKTDNLDHNLKKYAEIVERYYESYNRLIALKPQILEIDDPTDILNKQKTLKTLKFVQKSDKELQGVFSNFVGLYDTLINIQANEKTLKNIEQQREDYQILLNNPTSLINPLLGISQHLEGVHLQTQNTIPVPALQVLGQQLQDYTEQQQKQNRHYITRQVAIFNNQEKNTIETLKCQKMLISIKRQPIERAINKIQTELKKVTKMLSKLIKSAHTNSILPIDNESSEIIKQIPTTYEEQKSLMSKTNNSVRKNSK